MVSSLGTPSAAFERTPREEPSPRQAASSSSRPHLLIFSSLTPRTGRCGQPKTGHQPPLHTILRPHAPTRMPAQCENTFTYTLQGAQSELSLHCPLFLFLAIFSRYCAFPSVEVFASLVPCMHPCMSHPDWTLTCISVCSHRLNGGSPEWHNDQHPSRGLAWLNGGCVRFLARNHL